MAWIEPGLQHTKHVVGMVSYLASVYIVFNALPFFVGAPWHYGDPMSTPEVPSPIVHSLVGADEENIGVSGKVTDPNLDVLRKI